jgi:hypothetical protein
VKLSPSRAPLLHTPGETRASVAATSVRTRRFPALPSSNPSLHRTPAAQLSSSQFDVRPAPVSSKPLGVGREARQRWQVEHGVQVREHLAVGRARRIGPGRNSRRLGALCQD